jgi:glycosyltransferase 2 family protein
MKLLTALKQNMRPLKRLLTAGVYVCVALFIFLTLRDNFEQVKNYHIPHPAFIVAGMVAYAFQFLFNSYVWALLMRFGKERVSIRDSINVYVSSFVVRYIPGNVWAIAARAAMNKEYGVPAASSVWGWVIENITYLIVGMVFSVFILLNLDSMPREIVWALVIAFPACVIFLLRYELIERVVRFLAQKKFPDIAQKEFEKFELTRGDRVKLLGLYAVSWILYSLQFFFVAYAVGRFDPSTMLVLAGINALAWSIGYLSIITPSGTGVREGIIVFAMTTLGLATSVEAVAIALIARVSAIVAEVICFAGVKLFVMFNARRR